MPPNGLRGKRIEVAGMQVTNAQTRDTRGVTLVRESAAMEPGDGELARVGTDRDYEDP